MDASGLIGPGVWGAEHTGAAHMVSSGPSARLVVKLYYSGSNLYVVLHNLVAVRYVLFMFVLEVSVCYLVFCVGSPGVALRGTDLPMPPF